MNISSFNARGWEIPDPTPFEPGVRLGVPPQETLDQKLRRMIMIQRMDANDQIRDEADLAEDLNDFSDPEVGDENLFESKYEVGDDVPDFVSANEIRQKNASAPREPAAAGEGKVHGGDAESGAENPTTGS